MKILLDTNVPWALISRLAAAGHEVEHCGEWPLDPGDEVIVSRAFDSGQVVVTLDVGFTALILQTPFLPHGGILRLQQLPVRVLTELAAEQIELHADLLLAGYALIVEPGKLRRILPWKQRWE